MSEEFKCDFCKKPANQKCSGCHSVYYCSREHQKSGWKDHKKNCKPYKVCEDDILGRHLVATKPIKSGEIVLKEPALVWGPSQITLPVCLGCGKGVTDQNSRPCTKCGWPVCDEVCEKSPSHIPECFYTVNRGEKVSIKNFELPHPSYQCITALRCLYQKQFVPDTWQKLQLLESHCDIRKKTQMYETDRISVAQFIRRFFKLEETFTEEEILQICGIINVNGHEVPVVEPPCVAIYESTSMLEHDCRANCCKSFTGKKEVLVSSGVDIPKGDHISICYTDSLWGTPNRRHHLHETKFFWCSCQRCADPTEFGTYFSATKCNITGCKGFLLPNSFIGDDDDKDEPDWVCDSCQNQTVAYGVQKLLERIGKELNVMKKGSSKSCKLFLKNNETLLHQNHFYMTDVKFALAQIIGQEQDGGLSEVAEEELLLKINTCRSLSKLTEKLVPAEKRIRGILLFELHAAVAEMGRRKMISGEPGELHLALMESQKILLEVTELLKHEPEELPEGKIFRQAKKNLKEVDLVLKTVHATANGV